MAREVEARLRLSAVDRTAKAFNAVQGRLNAVERQTTRFNRTQGVLNRTQLALNRTMAAMPLSSALAPAALGYAGLQAVRAYADVERQLTRTGLTLGATKQQMTGLRDEVMSTANSYAIPISQVQETVDAYVAAGASLKEVQSDIDLLAKAQLALGATGVDTVSTWDAARKQLGLTTKDAEKFFNIVGAGASAGKFEAPDMAQYLPSLLPAASRQGFKGTEGAERLVGLLEVMRDSTGESGEAVTSVTDFLDKISSPTVEKAFQKIAHIDLRKKLKDAREGGKDVLKVMHDIIQEATGGDASRLGEFFGDKQARQAADVIMRQFDRVLAAQDEVRKNAPGLLDRNTAALMDNAEASLQRVANSYERIKAASGGFIVESGALDAVDAVTTDMERAAAALKAGWTPLDSLGALWPGGESPSDVVDRFAANGGLRTQHQRDLAKMYGQYDESRRSAATPEAVTSVEPLDKLAAIKAIQKAAGLEASGKIDAATRTAIKAFQAAAGIKVDGKVGPQTVGAYAKTQPQGDPVQTQAERDETLRQLNKSKQDQLTRDRDSINSDEERKYTRPGLYRKTKSFTDHVIEAGEELVKPIPEPVGNGVKGPFYREAEEASMAALRRDRAAIDNASGASRPSDAEAFNGYADELGAGLSDLAGQAQAAASSVAAWVDSLRPGKPVIGGVGEPEDDERMTDRSGVVPDKPKRELSWREKLQESNAGVRGNYRLTDDDEPETKAPRDGGGTFGAMLDGMDTVGTEVAQGGDAAGQSIRDAAAAVNQAGADGGSAFASMLRGVGQQIGADAAASFKANVGTINVNANVNTRVSGGPLAPASGNKGRSMSGAGGVKSWDKQ